MVPIIAVIIIVWIYFSVTSLQKVSSYDVIDCLYTYAYE